MFRLTDGEVNCLISTFEDTLDYLRNGEDGDNDEESIIFAVEQAIDLLDSLNYHENIRELQLIEDEEQEDTDAT